MEDAGSPSRARPTASRGSSRSSDSSGRGPRGLARTNASDEGALGGEGEPALLRGLVEQAVLHQKEGLVIDYEDQLARVLGTSSDFETLEPEAQRLQRELIFIYGWVSRLC